jgi:hypothetical protein
MKSSTAFTNIAARALRRSPMNRHKVLCMYFLVSVRILWPNKEESKNRLSATEDTLKESGVPLYISSNQFRSMSSSVIGNSTAFATA